MRKFAVVLLTTLNIITTLAIFFILYIMFTLTKIADPVTYQGQSYFILYGTIVIFILIVIGIWIAYYQLVIKIDPPWYWFYIVLGVFLLVYSFSMPIIAFFSILYFIAGFLFHVNENQ